MKIDKEKLPKAITDKYSVTGETFFYTPKDNLKDKIEVEIGDSKQADFYPQFKVMRWDNEVNFSMRAEVHPEAEIKTEGEKIKYITSDYEVHQYDKPDASDEGGFEFEWVLLSKPESNVLTTTIQHKNLDFFYQEEQTEEDKAQGGQQEERAIGSYAVYHKENVLNIEGGKEYKTGKAFHIYRPEAVDADGNRTWCELDITEENLTVTVPEEFLEKAVYPVFVDPTFGYTSAGATGTIAWFATQIASSVMVNPATAGSGESVTSFTSYIASSDGATRAIAGSAYTRMKWAMNVSGAGYSDVDGTYIYAGTTNGFPYYTKSGSSFPNSSIYDSSGGEEIFIVDSSGSTAYWSPTGASPDPDTRSNYEVFDTPGTDPAPTVTLEYYAPNARLAAGVDMATSSTSLGWVSSATVSQALTNGVAYVVGFAGGTNSGDGTTWVSVAYDNASVPGRINSGSSTLNASFGGVGTDSGRRYSVYATYGSAPPPATLKLLSLLGVGT